MCSQLAKMEKIRSKQNNSWEPLNIEYPVRLAPTCEISSASIGHLLRPNPQILRKGQHYINRSSVIESHKNAEITRDLLRSQTNVDFNHKPLTVNQRFCRATPAESNSYLHGGTKQLNRYPFRTDSHGVSEASCAYKRMQPTIVDPRLQPLAAAALAASSCFPRGSDPHVSASRQHRLFTGRDLEIAANDVITYYTFSNVPRVRGPKPHIKEWRCPSTPTVKKSVYDKEQFKSAFKESRCHNVQPWTPSSFVTETSKQFTVPRMPRESQTSGEELVKEYYHRVASKLRPEDVEKRAMSIYATEHRDMNSGKPILARIDQEKPKNIVFRKT